jgi:hypothetical protein
MSDKLPNNTESSTNNGSVELLPRTVDSELLRSIFTEQKEYVDYFFANLDYAQVEKFTNIILSCKGLIFLTGIYMNE